MKASRAAVSAGILLACHVSAHAWFIFIPNMRQPDDGGVCVGPAAQVGHRINVPDKGSGVIKSLQETSHMCRNSHYPKRAFLDYSAPADPLPTPTIANFQPPPALAAPAPVSMGFNTYVEDKCAPKDARPGGMHYDEKSGSGIIDRVVGASGLCQDPAYPQRVTVRFNGSPPAEKPAETASPAAAKLRELNGLLKDGLITQADYEAKKAEILKAF